MCERTGVLARASAGGLTTDSMGHEQALRAAQDDRGSTLGSQTAVEGLHVCARVSPWRGLRMQFATTNARNLRVGQSDERPAAVAALRVTGDGVLQFLDDPLLHDRRLPSRALRCRQGTQDRVCIRLPGARKRDAQDQESTPPHSLTLTLTLTLPTLGRQSLDCLPLRHNKPPPNFK